MTKKLAVILLYILVLASLLVIGNSFLNQLACEGQPINFRIDPTAEQQIFGEQILSQSFVSPRNNLNRIDIMFQTYQRQNTYDVFVRLLEASPDNPLQGKLIDEFTVNASAVRDRVWHTFTFLPSYCSGQPLSRVRSEGKASQSVINGVNNISAVFTGSGDITTNGAEYFSTGSGAKGT